MVTQAVYTPPTLVFMPHWQDLESQLAAFKPKSEIGQIIKRCFRYLPVELAQEMLESITRCLIFETKLEIVVRRHPESPYRIGKSLIEDYGVTSRKVVTTEGVTAMCVAWASATFDMKYMMLGTGAGAEAAGDTRAAMTEITATHYTSSVRPTCTHAESTNTIPIVGVHTHATAGDTIAEHAVANGATPAAGLIWDRSLTGTIVLAVSDGLTGTYTLTATAGG